MLKPEAWSLWLDEARSKECLRQLQMGLFAMMRAWLVTALLVSGAESALAASKGTLVIRSPQKGATVPSMDLPQVRRHSRR